MFNNISLFVRKNILGDRIDFLDFHVYWCSANKFINGINPYGGETIKNCLSQVNFDLYFWYPPIVLKFLCFFAKPIINLSQRIGLAWLLGADWLQPLLDKIPSFVQRFRYVVAVIFFGVFGICLYGTTQVKIDSNLVELYSDDVPIGQAYDIVDEHMMGTGNMIIVVNTG